MIEKYFYNKKIISDFIANNKKYFPTEKKIKKNKILVENFNFKPSLISFSYFAEVLKKNTTQIFFVIIQMRFLESKNLKIMLRMYWVLLT